MNYKKLLKKLLDKKKGGGSLNSFASSSTGQMVGTASSGLAGAINSNLDWKNTEEYDVSTNPLQKTTEGVMGSIPIASMFMGIGKIGEGAVDSFAPGVGEAIFSPHKKYLRMHETGKPEYGIPVVGSIMAANDSKKQLHQEKLDMAKEYNPYGDNLMKLGGALIKYDAPTHEQGGQMVDSKGIPTTDTNEAVAEIEKKETTYNGYVFSDSLKDTNGKTFAEQSISLDKKFKNKEDSISKRTRDIMFKKLSLKNDKTREEVEMKNGGDLKHYDNGGDLTSEDDFMALSNYFNGLTIPEKDKIKEIDNIPYKTTIGTNYQLPNGIETISSGVNPLEIQDKEVVEKENGTNYLTPARVGKGIELAGKAGILAAGYDKVKPEFNLNKGKVEALMRNRRVNTQSLINQINLQRNAALATNNSARSINVKRALDSQTYNNAAKQTVAAKLQEDSQNNNYRGQEASTLAQLGTEEKNARVLSEDLTARNKGQWLTNLGTVLGDVGRAGAFETKVKVNDMQITEGLAMLNNKYADFGLNEDTVKRLKEGKYKVEDAQTLADAIIKYKKQYNVK